MHNSKCHAIFFLMITSQEPTSNGVKIEVPETSDGENPYLETPNISDLMPVIFPGGGGGQSGGGGASGDWYSTPVSGDGMLAEIATFCGYASDWTYRVVKGVMVATRKRFLGSCTISRVGAGEWTEEPEHRRGFSEPLKRISIEGVDGESGYYLERYTFDGWHCGRTSTKQESYPIYDYYSPRSNRDSGEYSLEKWLWDREHGEQHMPPEGWIEYRCPSHSVSVPDVDRADVRSDCVISHRDIVVHCLSDEAWHVFNMRQYDIYASYDRYKDGVYYDHIDRDTWSYCGVLYDAGTLKKEIQRQHYPKIGTERVTLNYRPSALPVILGGSLPSYLILIVIVLLCAVNNSVTSSIDSDVRDDEQTRRFE